MQGRSLVAGVAVVLLFSACSTFKTSQNTSEQFSEEITGLLDSGEIGEADQMLGEMELYFSDTAEMQDLYVDVVEAHYETGGMETAAAAATRFAKMFPKHEQIDYVYYLGGMANYESGINSMALDGDTSSSLAARHSLDHFDALLACCADSKYAVEAKEKTIELTRLVSRYEFSTMRREFQAGDNTTALLIAQYIVRKFPNEDAAGLAALMAAASDDPIRLKKLLEITENPDVSAWEVRAFLSGAVLNGNVAKASGLKVTEPAAVAEYTGKEEGVAQMASAEVLAEAINIEITPTPLAVGAVVPDMKEPKLKSSPERSVPGSKVRLYTIQLASSRTLDPLKARMDKLGIADQVSYQVRDSNGEPLYSALYGGYAGNAEAQAALSEVKELTTVNDAWVKRMPKEGVVE
ncbi:outer membrane protein assembly factor BamD [Pseudomonadota bacterium]